MPMPASQTVENSHRDSLVQILFDKSVAGLLLLDQGRVTIYNPAAALALSLDGNAFGQSLRIDGPDGPLWERIMESTKGNGVFDYHMPANDDRGECTLQLSIVPLDAGKILV